MIWTIFVGLIAGLLARAIKPGANPMGWIMTIILGIVGAIVGGFLAGVVGLSATGSIGEILLSAVGAVIVLFAHEWVTGKKR